MTKQTEKLDSINKLREILKPGDTVYTVLRHVSASGMQRRIDLYVIRDNRPCWITYHAAKAIGYTMKRNKDGLVVNGCGMDMGFEAVYNLSHVVFDSTDRAGYVLRHEWM